MCDSSCSGVQYLPDQTSDMQFLGHLVILVAALVLDYCYGDILLNTLDLNNDIREGQLAIIQANTIPPLISNPMGTFPCTCGVFLTGQFIKGSQEPPRGNPVLLHELMEPLPCNAFGNKQCTNKCLDSIVKHLPNSPALICGSTDRDCHKERAYLFIKNCNDKWVNTNLSAGREYCCKDGIPYKCPLIS